MTVNAAHDPEKPDAPSAARSTSDTALADEDVRGENVSAEASSEVGGRGGLDPTRYGDWEKNGRCIDF